MVAGGTVFFHSKIQSTFDAFPRQFCIVTRKFHTPRDSTAKRAQKFETNCEKDEK